MNAAQFKLWFEGFECGLRYESGIPVFDESAWARLRAVIRGLDTDDAGLPTDQWPRLPDSPTAQALPFDLATGLKGSSPE